VSPTTPMLGDVELPLVQQVDSQENHVVAQHAVPALENDFLQRLGRRAARFTLAGVLTGPDVREVLKGLREKFRAAEPVPFVADIATATRVDRVLIEELGVRELAGRPERFEYALTLRELIEPPALVQEAGPQPIENEVQQQAEGASGQQIEDSVSDRGTLEVQVEVGEPRQFQGIVVIVEGEPGDGPAFSTRSREQVDGTYRFEGIPAGAYTVSLELQ